MNNRFRSVFLTLFVAAVLGAVAMPALADPPGVAGRLSFMQGPVSLQPGGVDDWVDATLNRPLTTSDRVWADQGARAEVSMGNVKARIDQQTSLTITNLDDNITQLELDQGSLFVHVRRLFGGESVEVDTPNVAFVVDREGDYRFDVDPNADTTYVSVRRGEGEGTGEAAGVRVRSGEQAVFSGGNSGQYQMSELSNMDDFDNWNRQRDDRQDHSASARYVSPGLVGYEDLDDNGSWYEDPQYGPVWRPRVEAGWAPYQTGHWAWIDPWGYTWVDDAPWGYAPFHYGRWVNVGGGWGWCPGRPEVYSPGVAYVRPVYAPALVAFIGGGGFGVSVGIGGGGPVGWVPLGYGEPYYPSYHVSENYVRNVNVTNTHITNITNVTNNYTQINNNNTTVINNVHYANQNVPGAVTAVPASAMASGRPVRQAAIKVDARQLQQAKFTAAPQVPPTREAVLGGRAPATQHTPPPSVVQRPVMTKATPPPPPAKFEATQQLLQKNGGRPRDAAQVRELPKQQRPAPMQAGKPRPAAAVQELNAAKPKGGAPPAFHPAPAKPAPGGPANAGKSGVSGPGNPAPANAGRPGEANNPATPRPAPGNASVPRPGVPNTPTARENNVPRPPSANAPYANAPGGRPNQPPARANEPAAAPNNPPARENNVPRPPSANAPYANAPGGRSNQPPARVNEPPARAAEPPARANQPPARAAEPPARANQPPARASEPPARPSQPPAREASVPRPPERQAAPAHNPPPAKENKQAPSKDEKKQDKPER
jgi:FecR protein